MSEERDRAIAVVGEAAVEAYEAHRTQSTADSTAELVTFTRELVECVAISLAAKSPHNMTLRGLIKRGRELLPVFEAYKAFRVRPSGVSIRVERVTTASVLLEAVIQVDGKDLLTLPTREIPVGDGLLVTLPDPLVKMT